MQIISFFSKNPLVFYVVALFIAGVHCTHGYNRTGFLIVAYLVLKQDWR